MMDAAEKAIVHQPYVGIAEVVLTGKFPTLGTNPHHGAFHDDAGVGFVSDQLTSAGHGSCRRLPKARNCRRMPPWRRQPDHRPNEAALIPFGAHKGCAMCLLNELYGALIEAIGTAWPATAAPADEKTTTTFISRSSIRRRIRRCLAQGRQNANLKQVLADIFGHGNEGCIPSTVEGGASAWTRGLHFTEAGQEFNELAAEIGKTD